MYRVRDFLATDELDIFLTHAHLDHVVGVTLLFDVLADKNVRRTTVHAEPAKLAAIREHSAGRAIFPVQPPCEFRPLADAIPLAQGGRLTWFPLEHPGRLGRVSSRLARPLDGLCHRHDRAARRIPTSKTFAASISWSTNVIFQTG